LQVAQKAGNEHIALDAAEVGKFRRKLAPVVARWVDDMNDKGIDGRALVDAARAAIARHSAH